MEDPRQQPLYELLHHPRIWRGSVREGDSETIATGHAALDACLPANGWPAGSLTEILLDSYGRGELRLLLPALARLSANDDGRRLIWVAPPWVPYAPALAAAGLDLGRLLIVHAPNEAEALWAAEQSLRCGSCAAVLAWIRNGAASSLRRLQLAAAEGDTFGVLFRPASARKEFSPAALRLSLGACADGLAVEVFKSRGGRPQTVRLQLGAARTRSILPPRNCGD